LSGFIWKSAWTKNFLLGIPLVGEARASLLPIKQVVMIGFNKVIFEGDSLVVVSAFLNPELPLEWRLESFISEARSLLSGIPHLVCLQSSSQYKLEYA
jgi:hypothetical protein